MCLALDGGQVVQILPRRTVATASQQEIIINFPMVAFFCAAVSLFILNYFTACRAHVTDTRVCDNLLCVVAATSTVDSLLIT